jgi:hypothetical protein
MLVLDLCSSSSLEKCEAANWEAIARLFWRIFFLVLEKSWDNVSISGVLCTCMELLSEMVSA